jgi:hypothetical protein
MRRQLIVSIALLGVTVSATTSSAQSALDHVLATLRDIRPAGGSNAEIRPTEDVRGEGDRLMRPFGYALPAGLAVRTLPC